MLKRGNKNRNFNPSRLKRESLRFFFFIFLFACFFTAGLAIKVFAEDVRITSSFDKRNASVGEEIHLTIRIAGAQGNIQAPRLPSFKGFDTFYTGRSSRITFVNGVSSSSVEFSYTLVPKQAGRHVLSGIEVTVNGQRYATDPIEISVGDSQGGVPKPSYTSQNAPFNPNVPSTRAPSKAYPPSNPSGPSAGKAPGGPIPQEPPPAFVPEDDNIFVRAWVDKTSVYPNEQILLSYSLYTRYDTRYEGFDKEAQVSGFWIEEFPMDKDVRRETVHVNGKRYVKADVKLMALFPTTAAEYTIDPGTLKASIRKEPENDSVFDDFFNDSFFSGGGFFARRENRLLKPAPIQITVKPFPEQGKPEGFQGAVGNFKISATIDKDSVKQNEPVTLKMLIEGEGNIETLNKPKIPELKNFKIYDSDTSSQLFKTGNVIGGRKTFEIVFIPTKPGQVKIPKFDFSFFNPIKGQYVSLSTPEFPLTVTPSTEQFEVPKSISQSDQFKKQIKVEGSDIRYIWERLPDASSEFYFDLAVKFLAAGTGLLFIGVLLGKLRRRQEKVYAKDQALKRRKYARSRAESSMRKLNRKNQNFFEEAEKVLTRYLSDKFNLSAHGMTRLDLEFQLREALGSEDPLLNDIRGFYEVCDESRFGRGNVPEELRERAVTLLKKTIARVEKMKR